MNPMDNIIVRLANQASALNSAPTNGNTPFRPPQWGTGAVDQEQLIYMRPNIAEKSPDTEQAPGQLIGYFFDAIIRTEHSTTLRITEHPIQSGANISDHAYMLPCTLTMEIGMSDAMDAFISNQFSESYTKSISAYQTLLRLQKNRMPLQIMTRLNLYQNMVIEHIGTTDDFKTVNALRVIVSFKQIIVANVSLTKVSARPQVTVQTNKGNVQPTPVDASLLKKIKALKTAMKALMAED